MEDRKITAETAHSVIGNNLGEMFKEGTIKHSKAGEKLQLKKEGIERAKDILKTLDMDDDVETAKEKVKRVIQCLYNGRGLDNQLAYLEAKRVTTDVVTQAYYIVSSKQEYMQKALDDMENEVEGF